LNLFGICAIAQAIVGRNFGKYSLVLAALSFLIVGYDQKIRILPFAVAFLVSGLAILWWSVRAKA
jgi:hypothetical protein